MNIIEKRKILLSKIKTAFLQLLKRKSIFQITFTSGTTTWKECLMVIGFLIKFDGIRNGKWIGIFHQKISELMKVKFVFTFSAARMGLYTILKSLDFHTDDEIILPGFTCVVLPAAIIYAGCKPIYVDISPEDYNIDVIKIEEKITKRTKAIIAQHTYGNPCNMEALKELCIRYNLVLIEDCAHIFGTYYKGEMLGTIGDVAFFSTDHTKFISTSVGGIVVTNSELIGEKIEKYYKNLPFLKRKDILKISFQFIITNILFHPQIAFLGKILFALYNKLGLCFFMNEYEEIKMPELYPYPAKMSNIQAKIGISQLKYLAQNIAHRRNIYKEYCDIFHNCNIKNTSDTPLRFVLEVNNRQQWIKKLSPVVSLETWFESCAHNKKANFWEVNYQIGECPIAENVGKLLINFPTHLKIRIKDLKRIKVLIEDEFNKS